LLEAQFYDSENRDDSSLSSSVLFNWKVDFLHRTVRDFLIKSDVRKKLEGWANPDFDANIVTLKATLAQIKTAPGEGLLRGEWSDMEAHDDFPSSC